MTPLPPLDAPVASVPPKCLTPSALHVCHGAAVLAHPATLPEGGTHSCSRSRPHLRRSTYAAVPTLQYLRCSTYADCMGFDNCKRDTKVVKKELAEACAHIVFCFEMYEIQRRAGR